MVLFRVAPAVTNEAVVRKTALLSIGSERGGVSLQHRLFECLEAQPPDPARRAGEAPVHQLIREPEHLEQLAAAVARHGGDAHLGHDLKEPELQRLHQPGVAGCPGPVAFSGAGPSGG